LRGAGDYGKRETRSGHRLRNDAEAARKRGKRGVEGTGLPSGGPLDAKPGGDHVGKKGEGRRRGGGGRKGGKGQDLGPDVRDGGDAIKLPGIKPGERKAEKEGTFKRAGIPSRKFSTPSGDVLDRRARTKIRGKEEGEGIDKVDVPPQGSWKGGQGN